MTHQEDKKWEALVKLFGATEIEAKFLAEVMGEEDIQGTLKKIRETFIPISTVEEVGVDEWAEKIVIEYANHSGRADNRTFVREAARTVLAALKQNLISKEK